MFKFCLLHTKFYRQYKQFDGEKPADIRNIRVMFFKRKSRRRSYLFHWKSPIGTLALSGWDSLKMNRWNVQFCQILGHVGISRVWGEDFSRNSAPLRPTFQPKFHCRNPHPWGNNVLKILAHNWWHCSTGNLLFELLIVPIPVHPGTGILYTQGQESCTPRDRNPVHPGTGILYTQGQESCTPRDRNPVHPGTGILYTQGQESCTPRDRNPVHPGTGILYTQGQESCTPRDRNPVHPGTGILYTQGQESCTPRDRNLVHPGTGILSNLW